MYGLSVNHVPKEGVEVYPSHVHHENRSRMICKLLVVVMGEKLKIQELLSQLALDRMDAWSIYWMVHPPLGWRWTEQPPLGWR